MRRLSPIGQMTAWGNATMRQLSPTSALKMPAVVNQMRGMSPIQPFRHAVSNGLASRTPVLRTPPQEVARHHAPNRASIAPPPPAAALPRSRQSPSAPMPAVFARNAQPAAAQAQARTAARPRGR